jgi:Ca2+:H+ antiporter
MVHTKKIPVWTWAVPIAGLVFFALASSLGFDDTFGSSAIGIMLAVLLVPLLIFSVFASVYHAEDVAHLTGEPVGTLVLTLSVVIIELALIVSLTMTGKAAPTLVRDTVFSIVMIVTTGLVGLCIITGGLRYITGAVRYREQIFDVTSAKIYLAVLFVLCSITLVLPNYTNSAPEQVYTDSQLAFVSIATIALYLLFIYTQMVLHRDYFTGERDPSDVAAPNARKIIVAIGLLAIALIAVILLAKLFAVLISVGVDALGASPALKGVIVAAIVLTPEAISAVRAAHRDDLQKSINLALGTTLSTIGLTVPAIAAVNVFLHQPLVLGLEQRDVALLVTTLGASILTFGTGRTNVLFGFLHLVLFGMFLVLVIVP